MEVGPLEPHRPRGVTKSSRYGVAVPGESKLREGIRWMTTPSSRFSFRDRVADDARPVSVIPRLRVIVSLVLGAKSQSDEPE